MKQKDFTEELKKREKQLSEQLKAVRILLGAGSSNIDKDGMSDEDGSTAIIKQSGTPKGSRTWVDYTMHMLKEIGGKGKTIMVVKAAQKANPNIGDKRIKHAIRHHLSKLYIKGKIDAKEGKYRKDGYTFSIKK